MIPFGGITFIVHGIVIVVNLAYQHLVRPVLLVLCPGLERALPKKQASTISKFSQHHPRIVLVGSLGIIIVVTSCIVTLAGVSLRSSVSTHSNLELVQALFEGPSGSVLMVSPTAQDPMVVAAPRAIFTASTPGLTTSRVSLVDFLGTIGIESSFDYRAQLAERAGVSAYVGSAEQNIHLLEVFSSDMFLQQILKRDTALPMSGS